MLVKQLILIICVSVVADAAYRCPGEVSNLRNVHQYRDKCYQFVINIPRDFMDAKNYCQLFGGNLAMVRNQETNNFLAETIERTYRLHTSPFWIGLYYLPQDKVYMWVDGSKANNQQYHNFLDTPVNKHDLCVAIIPKTRIWKDLVCKSTYSGTVDLYKVNNRHHFVCEYQAILRATTTITTTERPGEKITAISKTTGVEMSTTKTSTKSSHILSTTRSLPKSSPKTTGIDSKPRISKRDCPVQPIDSKNLQVNENKCYVFYTEDKQYFQNAETFCELNGGSLAVVKSKEINSFLQEHLVKTINRNSPFDAYWIGLKYRPGWSPAGYYWVDGTPLEFSNFEHQRAKECVTLNAVTGKWWEEECLVSRWVSRERKFGFICEFDTNKAFSSIVTANPHSTTLSTPKTITTTPTTTTVTPNVKTTTPTTTKATPTAITPRNILTRNTSISTKPISKTTTSAEPNNTPTTIPQTAAATNLVTAKTTPTSNQPLATATCPLITCELDCDLDGYHQNSETGCVECQCND